MRRKDMTEKFELLIGGFLDDRIGICNDFLTKELAFRLRENLMDLDKTARMTRAGIGNDLVKDPAQNTRGDKIFWINNRTEDAAERIFLEQINQFVAYLNDTCYAGIGSYEFHYALYETGSAYKRHVDQFQNNADRKFSLISYLNEDWTKEDGGELGVHRENRVEKILPQMQKAVFFKSDDCEHEVYKSLRPRMSISGWLKS